MQPLQYDLRCPAAKDKSITHADVAPSNLDAAMALQSATRESTNANNHAHMNNHSLQNTEEEPITRWNDPSRTRRTHEVPFIAGCSHFTRKNIRFHAPASSPNQSLCNIHAAMTVRSATRESTNAWNHAHMNNHSLQNTEEEPITRWNDPSRTRRTHEVPLIAGCSHFTQKNTRFHAPASSPNQSPCNIHDLHSHSTLHWV